MCCLAAEYQRSFGVDQGVDRLMGAERLQPAGHGRRRHEGGRGEDQQEYQGHRRRLCRLRVADPQAERREAPGDRVAERDHQAERGEQAAGAVRAAEPGGEADAGHDRDHEQVAGQVGDGPAAQHGDPGHRQGAEADQDAGAQVAGQPDRGADRAEGDRLREDARHQEVHVVRARHVDRAAERVAEKQHEDHWLDGGEHQRLRGAQLGKQVAPGDVGGVRERAGDGA
ncbi:MAG TPA: hypothetical protein VGG16_28940 [Streptosporangiaceae bacterium]